MATGLQNGRNLYAVYIQPQVSDAFHKRRVEGTRIQSGVGRMTILSVTLPLVGSLAPTGATTLQTPSAMATVAGQPSFGSMLSSMATGAMDDTKTAESTAISGLTGASSVQQVVEAVGTAQDSLNITMAVRNKALSAYQQIEQMTI